MTDWDGMPEFNNPPKEVRKLIVHFENEDDVADFFERIGQRDSGRKSIWYPPRQHRKLETVRWISDDS